LFLFIDDKEKKTAKKERIIGNDEKNRDKRQ
jgi:hypothetical protein